MPLIATNAWNRRRYTLWAPFYNLAVRGFNPCRRRSLALLAPQPGERLLLVGAGTGADLDFLPDGATVLATDLTPAMLWRARSRLRRGQHLAQMDGHALGVPDGAFDAAVLHLILAVLPDPVRCLRESSRALRRGGRAVVFDKFVRGEHTPLALELANFVTRVLATEVTRRFEDILEQAQVPLRVEDDQSALAGGLFRYILLRKH